MTDYFHLNINHDALLSLSTLGLAHLGDGVYEVMVRSWLVLHGKAKAKDLHRATVGYVSPRRSGSRRFIPFSLRRSPTSSAGAGTPPPTPSPRRPAGPSTRPPPAWKPCLAGCTSRGEPSG